MLARQVADLAGLWGGGDASRAVATEERVEMATSGAAVATSDGVVMDVVEERAALGGEAREADLEENTSAAGIRLSYDGAADIGLGHVRERSAVRDTGRVVGDDRSILSEGGDLK